MPDSNRWGSMRAPFRQRLGALAVVLLAGTTQAEAVIIASWDMFGQPGNQAATPASDSAPGVSPAALTRGPGLNAAVARNAMSSNGWGTPPQGNPASDTDYFSFGFTVNVGKTVDLDELIIGTRSSNTGPGTLGLFYSGNGFGASLFTFTQPGSGFLNSVVDLSSLTGLTGTVEFRILEIGNTQADGSGSTSSAGTLRIVDHFAAGTFTDTQFTGSVKDVGGPGPVSNCGAPGATPIWQIQGSGPRSPADGKVHSIEGVVVGDFQPTDGTGLSGFFVQEEDLDADGDASTSDGIFVYYPANTTDVMSGDIVRVTGRVQEFKRGSDSSGNTATQLTAVSAVEVCPGLSGSATPVTVSLPLPSDPDTDLEPVEGMAVDLVAATGDLTLVEYFNLDRFGEIRVASDGRPVQFTLDNPPNVAGNAAHKAALARRTLLVDDGRSGSNLSPIYFGQGGQPLDVQSNPQNLLRGGDRVSIIEGVMHYDFGSYRIEPVLPPVFQADNPRPPQVPAVDGRLRVVSYNVLNYFQQLDDGTAKCGPPGPPSALNGQECRGADQFDRNSQPLVDSQGRNERDRQEAKLIPALLKLDADIYGLVELENDFGSPGTTAAQRLADLMDLANTSVPVTGCSDYEAVDPGGYVGDDVIAVGILYCADSVELAAGTSVEILDDADLGGLGLGHLAPLFNGDKTNRAALAATFDEVATGARLTLAVNHFKSKGPSGLDKDSACQATPPTNPDCDQGDGQGYWNQRRTDASGALETWLRTDPTGSNDPDLLILGDLNAYAKEDPIAVLESAGYENLIARGGPGAYSFLFDAQLGYLDYALANGSLAAQVRGVVEWHINADEPDALDYDISFNPEQWYSEDEFRTSDHDPVVVGLDLTIAGDLDGDLCIGRGDVLQLINEVRARTADPATLDINGDGRVDFGDGRALVQLYTNPRGFCP